MTTIRFIYRPTRGAKEGTGSIFMRITRHRKSRTQTVARGIYPHEWDRVNQCLVIEEGDKERVPFLENCMNNISSHLSLLAGITGTLEKQGYYSVDDIMDKYRMITGTGSLISYTEKLANELERRHQHRTADAYRTCVAGFLQFTRNAAFSLSDINAGVIREFANHLKGRGKAPNTISYYMRTLRAIYNKAVAGKRIPEKSPRPFSGVFTGFHKTTKRSITPAELEILFRLDLPRKLKSSKPGSKEYERYVQLYKAWRIFFFCFYAQGLCFVDLSYLKKENIRGGMLSYYRRKTGQLIEVNVSEDMRYIIDSFSDETAGSPYLFPIIINPAVSERTQYSSALRAQNRRLAELSKMAGLERKVTTHVVRHTYATLLKRNHLPVSVISQSLGHTTEKTTTIYLDSLDRTVIEQANKKVTAPFPLVRTKEIEIEENYGKRIVDLLQNHIADDEKARIYYTLLKTILTLIKIE